VSICSMFLVTTSMVRPSSSVGLNSTTSVPAERTGVCHRRYGTDVLGRLAFIGVAQSAGFKLTEIKDLVRGVDGTDGMASQMRALFPSADEASVDTGRVLTILHVKGKDCRRVPEPA
jgi:hypothetical protein